MPREHKTIVYTYEELSPEAQEKARNWWREIDQFDSQYLSDIFKDTLREWGFEKGVDVWWSLNSSQGDGVAFQGSLDIPKYVNARAQDFRRMIGHVEVYVKHEGRYTHWNSMEVTVEESDSRKQLAPKDWFPGTPTEEMLSEFEEFVKEDVKDMSRELEKMGYGEIEYQNSDEVVAENIIANEYEFTADGRRFMG